MPIYEFQCRGCATVFEELVRMGSTGEGLHCPDCGTAEIRKKVSTFFGRSSSNGHTTNLGGGCGCGGNCGGNCGSCGDACTCH
jgi:putative FmdB family regulatory protein